MAALGVSPIHLDSLPLLPITTNRRLTRRPSLSNAVRFLRRATARRMTQPSLAVREAAAEQLEDRQSDWANSRPVLLLDVLWNLSFVAVAVGVLSVSLEENPSVPLRVWIVGYALQCVVHVVSIGFEYWKRRDGGGGGGALNSDSYDDERSSISKHMESANTMFSFVWWIIGFYWVSAGGETLTRDAPQLYWLSIVFLAFDVFFVVFCVALACLIGFAVCCCLPCIIAILYAVADQEGASDEDINQLPKYKFHKTGNAEKLPTELSGPCGGIMRECNSDQPIEHVLTAENAECCICISAYEDGVELRELPCGHHFHCACIDKWLYINATCPLCKFNIVKHSHDGSEEV